MRSDKAALSTVQDALGLGAAMVDVAYTAMNSAIDVVNQIKSKLVAAREPGVDKHQDSDRNHAAAEAAQGHRRTRPRSPARTGCRSTPATAGFSSTRTVVSSFNRTGTPCQHPDHRYRHLGDGPVRFQRGDDQRGRRHPRRQPDRDRRHRQHGDHLVGLQPRHLRPDRQRCRRHQAEQLHRRRRYSHQGNDGRSVEPRRDQVAHQPAAGLREKPDGCPRTGVSARSSMPT